MNSTYTNFTTTMFILATVGAYAISRVAAKRYPSPLTTPAFFSTLIIISILTIGSYTVVDYSSAKTIITYLLGPATVALAVPLYKNRRILSVNIFPVATGLVVGSVSTIIAAFAIAKAFSLSQLVITSMATKSITAAVAVEVAPIIHANPALAAFFVVITGMFGAMAGPYILNKFKIKNPLARGLSMGTVAHGQDTAQALTEGELQGAAASIAMCMTALLVPLIAPLLPKLFV